MPTHETTDLAWQAHNTALHQLAERWAQLALDLCARWDAGFPEHRDLLRTVLIERLAQGH